MPEEGPFLLRSSRAVIAHCEALLASSRSEAEQERLRRIVDDERRFINRLAGLAQA